MQDTPINRIFSHKKKKRIFQTIQNKLLIFAFLLQHCRQVLDFRFQKPETRHPIEAQRIPPRHLPARPMQADGCLGGTTKSGHREHDTLFLTYYQVPRRISQ